MPSDKGKLITCDRCGRTVFLKCLGKGVADGGYTTWDKYEELPKEWLYENQFGYLCEECADRFRTWVYDFIGDKLAPVWKPISVLEGEKEE